VSRVLTLFGFDADGQKRSQLLSVDGQVPPEAAERDGPPSGHRNETMLSGTVLSVSFGYVYLRS